MTAPDRVILRRWRDGGEVIALFIDQRGYGSQIESYERLGGHGGADYQAVMDQTTLVRIGEPDALAMLDHLRGLGYNPLQMLRRNRR